MKLNLPNKISIVRIVLIPVFLVFFLLDGVMPYARLAATFVFILASITDFVDGHIARKYNLVTDLGKFLDNIADKMLVISALIAIVFAKVSFAPESLIEIIILICVVIIVIRELLITMLRQIAAVKTIVIAADKYGKMKTATQMVAISFLIAGCDMMPLMEKIGLSFNLIIVIGFALLVVSTLLALLSAVNYFIKNKGVFKDTPKEN